MKVVMIGASLPYPLTTGGRIRIANLLIRVAKRHEVTYLATHNPDRAEAEAARAFLGDHGVATIEVEHAVPKKSGPLFYARLAANLAESRPYSVASHASPALTAMVRKLAAERQVDLWQAEWAAGMEALRALPEARTIVMAQNVETRIWERYAENESRALKRWYIQNQARKFDRFEGWAYRRAGRVVAVSEEDAALIRSRFRVPEGRVDVVDNGIDRAFFEATPADLPRDPKRLLFLGSLDWRPNLDGLNVWLDRVYPALRQAEPALTLDVVGRKPPASLVRRLEATEGATLHADVPDVRPFLARSALLVVPLRVGGGSRLKILEALAAGLPVVSTRVGAEGLCLRDGEHLDVCEDIEGLAEPLFAALREPGRVRAQAEAGRALVRRRYDWDALSEALERCWDRCFDLATA